MSNEALPTVHSNDTLAKNDERFFAALDIGSNSFHYVYARLSNNNLQILHTEKYQVKLADGLNDDNVLSNEAIQRGLATLSNLLSSTVNLSEDNFRVVATYTLRQASNAKTFLKAAKAVFPFDIEIISGHEEARLIYQGVAHNSDASLRQLIIDIGGGSTECVIGEQFNIKAVASLNIGCVSFQQRFFPDEKISSKRFKQAINEAKYEIEPIIKRFNKKGWQHLVGTSGTIKTVYNIINAAQAITKPIELAQLHKLKNKLIKIQSTQNIQLDGLKENRRDILCSGVAILIALFEMLGLDKLHYCPQALREGVIYQQLDLMRCNDIRQRSIDSLAIRFSIDQNHASKVSELALSFYQNVSKQIKFPSSIYQNLLIWAAQIHELGIDINPAGYQKHGEYILKHADIPGFNEEQQQALAWLVGNQRKKITAAEKFDWYSLDPQLLMSICILLRLSVLLNQQRQLTKQPPATLSFNFNNTSNDINLNCEPSWLLERPLVDTELFHEQQYLAKVDLNLNIVINELP